MPLRLPHRYLLAGCALLVQACAQAPQAQLPPEPVSEPAAEIRLNLAETAPCDCPPVVAGDVDYTFFERGMEALAAGNLAEAVQYVQRYRRLEPTPAAAWEEGIALAYIATLPSNPERDIAGARRAFEQLNKREWRDMPLHPQSLLLRQALRNFLQQEQRSTDLARENSSLRDDLAKREETIKRLRELTLGQKGGSP